MINILFRGVDIATGEFVEGNYCCADMSDGTSQHFIIEMSGDRKPHMIDPESLGQWTGLRDITQKKAFSGDVTKDKQNHLWVIYFGPGGFGMSRATEYLHNLYYHFEPMSDPYHSSSFMKNHRIIGNIYDNPELVGGI